jgi:hypothetical protein
MTQSSKEKVAQLFSDGSNVDALMRQRTMGPPPEVQRAPQLVRGRSGSIVREYDPPVRRRRKPKVSWVGISQQFLAVFPVGPPVRF